MFYTWFELSGSLGEFLVKRFSEYSLTLLGQLGAVHILCHILRQPAGGGGDKLNVDNHTTQCHDEFRNLSGSVLKILTVEL